jgi:hypothetical protein
MNAYAYTRNSPTEWIDPNGTTIHLPPNERQREAVVAMIGDSLQHEAAAERLVVRKLLDDEGSTSYVLGVKGSIQEFANLAETAATIAKAIESTGRISVRLGDLDRGWGGASTEQVGAIRRYGDSVITIDEADIPVKLEGLYTNTRVALQHELGHALYYTKPANVAWGFHVGLSNEQAMKAENAARAWYRERARKRFGEGSLAAKMAAKHYRKRDSHPGGG